MLSTALVSLSGCGKPPTLINVANAKNMDEVAALLRDLYRRNARPGFGADPHAHMRI